LLVAVVVTPAVTLVWLGLQLLDQDRELMAQRDTARREASAQAAVRSFERSITNAERAVPLGAGLVRFTFVGEGLRADPPDRVWWVPAAPRLRDVDARAFSAGERLEFGGDLAAARVVYDGLTRSPDAAMRAGALLRLARVDRRAHRWNAALDAYGRLAEHVDIAIEGAPADLQARRARCDVLEDAGRIGQLRAEAATLESDWLAGRWMLDRPAWELTAARVAQWTGRTVPRVGDRTLFSAVADEIWRAGQESNQANPADVLVAGGIPVTVLRRRQDATPGALIISPAVLERWTRNAVTEAGPWGSNLSVLSPTGSTLAGPDPALDGLRVPAAAASLPWTLVVAADPAAGSGDLESRRRLLTAGLGAIVLLLAGGGYVLWRLVQRELTVGRLQTEFVAAVSHEFRTPLTSLRHVTELLEEGDEMPPERRQSFYGVLGRNTERLHKLVESLLDFARMEDGRKPYDLQPVDAAAIATTVVTDSRENCQPARRPSISTSIDPRPRSCSPMRLRWRTRCGTCSTMPSSTRPAAGPYASRSAGTRRASPSPCTTRASECPLTSAGKSSGGSCAVRLPAGSASKVPASASPSCRTSPRPITDRSSSSRPKAPAARSGS